MELVAAVALLVLGLAFIGGRIQQTADDARECENLTRLLLLAEMKMAELDTGLVNLGAEADAESEGDFTLRFPDHGWRMRFDELTEPGLWMITLSILHSPRESLDAEFDFREARVVYTAYTLRPQPTPVDLQADFGLDDAAAERLSEQMPIEGFDPTDFDPSIFASMDVEELLTVLPALMQAFGISMQELANIVPPEFRDLLEQELSDIDEGDEATGDAQEGTAPPVDNDPPLGSEIFGGDSSSTSGGLQAQPPAATEVPRNRGRRAQP